VNGVITSSRISIGVITRSLALAAALALCPGFAPAQNENDPSPRDFKVRIVFLPPPMEGTLSVGIYNPAGKLVRTLRSEATPEKDFVVGLNGLSAPWDGKDDAGQPAPAGKYQARGFCVGPLGVSGEAILANDWFDGDEATRIASVVSLDAVRGELLLLTAKRPDGSTAQLQCDRNGRLQPRESKEELNENAALGKDGSLWTIDKGEAGPEVKQFSKDKEFIRRLAVARGEPAPMQIAASKTEDVLFLLEEKPGEQRLRGLALDATAPDQGSSTWKMFLSKRIVASPDFASIKAELQPGDADFKPGPKLTVTLVPNPLLNDAATNVDLQVAFDAKGSFLRSADGLRLADLSDTQHLRWLVFGSEGASRTLNFFQGDGAVVEQFHLRRPNNMMAFDAGEYELKR
jgi:hypothetical protein